MFFLNFSNGFSGNKKRSDTALCHFFTMIILYVPPAKRTDL